MARRLLSLENQQAAARAYVQAVLDARRIKPSRLAKEIGRHASTIARFMNDQGVTHTLELPTIWDIAAWSGIPVPEDLLLAYGQQPNLVIPGDNIPANVSVVGNHDWRGGARGEASAMQADDDDEKSNVRPRSNIRLDFARNRVEDVPVRGVVRGGADGAFELNMGEPIEYMRRPVSVLGKGEIYALHVEGDSMAPRYEPGESILVWANRPALIGRDVVIQVKPKHDGDNPLAFLKRLVKRTSTEITVAQFNPAKTRVFKIQDVISIHMVLTRDEMI